MVREVKAGGREKGGIEEIEEGDGDLRVRNKKWKLCA